MNVLWLAAAAVAVHIAWRRGVARGWREGRDWQARIGPAQAAAGRLGSPSCPLCEGSGVLEEHRS